MQAAMDAQVAFSKKYPAKTQAENAALIAKSQKMMETNYTPPVQRTVKQTTALNKSRNTFDPIRANAVPGGGVNSVYPPVAVTKKIDKLISTKKSTMGSGSNWQRNPHTGGF
jgi:hypothetical protein